MLKIAIPSDCSAVRLFGSVRYMEVLLERFWQIVAVCTTMLMGILQAPVILFTDSPPTQQQLQEARDKEAARKELQDKKLAEIKGKKPTAPAAGGGAARPGPTAPRPRPPAKPKPADASSTTDGATTPSGGDSSEGN